MRGAHCQPKYLNDLNWGVFADAAHALQLRACSDFTHIHIHVVVCLLIMI